MGLDQPMIKVSNVTFHYGKDRPAVLKDIDVTINRGQYVSIIGHNGSGKSTLARLLNGLLLPEEGTVEIQGLSTANEEEIWKIRHKVGMVFQNPDNQFVAPTVEDDLAFGLENLGVDPEKMEGRIRDALERVDMLPYRHTEPSRLSGGQKQRVAIGGMLALHPEVLVLDEATAMLDPKGRRDVLDIVKRMNEEEGITIIQITHYLEETLNSHYIYVMDQGQIVKEGTPTQLYQNPDLLRKLGLDVPFAVDLHFRLQNKGLVGEGFSLTSEGVISALWT
ncbi:MAG TPA: energy-coupling factor transporter ATPase [Paenibacillaceae bacterium]|nr:energy-coupling factor transporter ATPase [Paenibacillaceae bacterium]